MTARNPWHLAARTIVVALVAAIASAVLGCSRSDTAQTLVLTGSSTVAPLAGEIGKRFEAENPGVRVDVQTGGSSRGIADARRGTADIGMASRALGAGEEDLVAIPIARDGVCVIVHRDNPVAALSDEQIVAIYTGKIESWDAVGGAAAPITVVTKASGRATLEVFLGYFGLEEDQVDADIVIGDNEQGVKTVSGDPNAIGFVSVGNAEYSAAAGAPLRLLPAGGVEASTATLESGAFPISRPLNFVFTQAPTGLAKQLSDYARSEAVHDLVRELGFVPIR